MIEHQRLFNKAAGEGPLAFTTALLTPERWPDFEQLFGKQGACYGCWCTYWRREPSERKASGGVQNRVFMKERVEAGPPPGILVYEGDGAVGWVQVGPRADVSQWNRPTRVTAPLHDGPADDPAVWAISCHFIRAKERGRGISHVLLAAAIDHARNSGARLLEACPMDRAKQAKSVCLCVGSTSVFDRAGFVEVARRKEGRPLMRLVLRAGE